MVPLSGISEWIMSWWNIISPSGSAPIGSPFSRILEISMIPGFMRAKPFGCSCVGLDSPPFSPKIVLFEILVGEDDDKVIEPGLVDRLDGGVIRLLAQVDAADFRADVLREGD